MAVNDLTITVKAVGIPEAQAQLEKLGATMQRVTVNQNGTVSATGKVTSALDNQGKATDRVTDSTNRASKAQAGYFGHIAKTTIQSALINKLFLEFVDVSGQAIQQVDLMNNFPATMASMGQSTKDAGDAFQTLRDYVGQVGGNLGDATSYVTRFTGAIGDVKSATAVFVGLNNALIAGDSSMLEQQQAAVQFAQALERGKPDLREWRTLTQNMSFQLTQVAQSMGYVNANDLGEALTNGEESMAAFTTALTKMATGTGPIAQQAIARMNGMQFAFNVMKNTLTQGLAEIINTLGRQNIVSFFSFLTQVIRVLTRAIIVLIGWIVTLLNLLGGLFGLPAIKLKKDTGAIADNIGSGAGSAEDLGDGLKKAGKEAAKLNKGLASFDKMNVLADKTSGSGGGDDDAGGGGSFDAGQVGALGDVFGDIGGEMAEVSKWAKVFAGILGALAANKLIEKIFGVNPLKLFAKAIGKYAILPLLKFAATAASTAAQFVGTFAVAIGRGLLGLGSGGSGILGTAAGIGAKIGLAIRTGLAAAFTGIGGVISTIFRAAILPVLTAIGTFVLGLVGVVGAPLWLVVAVGAAVVAAVVALFYIIWQNWETIWNFISGVFTAFWGFLVSTWNTLYDIFKGPVEFIWQFISSIFILIVAIVATALELIFKLVVGTIKLIYDVLAAIAGWIYDNVIKPVADFFVALWQGIVDAAVAAWQWIYNNVLAPVASWVNTNVIQPVLNFFKGLWNSVSSFVSDAITKIKNFLSPLGSWIKSNVIDRIANFFSGLWDGVKNGLSNMINGLKNIFNGIGNVFKTPINGIIDLINKVLQNLNRTVKVPDWVPGLGGKGVNFPTIPRLAKGGIVDQATMAIIGESGSEAVMPLENNTEWIDTLASMINEKNGGGQPVQLVVQIGEDKIASKVIDLINEKTHMSGRNAIFV